MFGRFLEISLSTSDIATSVLFYERLGFTQLSCADTWPYPYGALTDGRVVIGLHQRHPAAPELSFVCPDLVHYLRQLQAAGFEPHATRLGENDFHELRFCDPAGQQLVLLEARTFSPRSADSSESACGYFSAYSLPTTEVDATRAFWERAGFVALEPLAEPYAHVPLTSDHLSLALHQPKLLNAPALVFTDPQMSARLSTLQAREVQFAPTLLRGLNHRSNAMIEAPEGTLLLLLNVEQ